MAFEAVTWATDKAPLPRTETGKFDPVARSVLVALAEVSRAPDYLAFPTITTLHEKTLYHPRTIRRAIQRLEAARLITEHSSRWTAYGPVKVWKLNMDHVRSEEDKRAIREERDQQRAAERARWQRRKEHKPDAVPRCSAEVEQQPIQRDARDEPAFYDDGPWEPVGSFRVMQWEELCENAG